MSAYRKALVAFLGFTLIVLGHLMGVISGTAAAVVDSVIAGLTWIWVYIVPNSPPPNRKA